MGPPPSGSPALRGRNHVLFIGDAGISGTDQRIEIAKSARREGFAVHIAETVSEKRPARNRSDFVTPFMIFVEVIAQHFLFARPRGRRAISGHVPQVHSPNHEFNIRGQIAWVVPDAVHIAIISVGRHGAGLMPIHVQAAAAPELARAQRGRLPSRYSYPPDRRP